jgi:DNA-binding NtrC family response regulator
MERILIIEDKDSFRQMLQESLLEEGYEVVGVKEGKQGIDEARKSNFDIALVDLKLPKRDGIEVLKEIKTFEPLLTVIMMTAYGTIEKAVQAMKEGASDFLEKPFEMGRLFLLIERSLEENRLVRENLLLKEVLGEQLKAPKILGQSQSMKDVAALTQKVAQGDSTVLLLGETGTGKELFARAIHTMSKRKNSPLVAINCSAIPPTLLENELFGSEKGAFTGAYVRKRGKFELAHKGTLFLDEIGELSPELQAKLLRVLEQGQFERLGGTETLQVDIRLIAATNKDLKRAMDEQKFREDLYYRLSVFPIQLPPLRERPEDIPLLASHFLEKFSRELNKGELSFSSEAMGLLQKYSWPGNVRELVNTIERGILLSERGTILPENLGISQQDLNLYEMAPKESLRASGAWGRRVVEARLIRDALKRTGGNKRKAAKELKVSYKTLFNKMKEYKIEGVE